MSEPKPKAPGLSSIIGIKLSKGAFFVVMAVVAYCLSDNNLLEDYLRLLDRWHLNPENIVWGYIAAKLVAITQTNVLWMAGGTLAYSLLAMVEGIGLFFRVTWASWLAIGEAAFFVPIELYELARKFTAGMIAILAFNLFILYYLLKNRKRLFHHVHFSLLRKEHAGHISA